MTDEITVKTKTLSIIDKVLKEKFAEDIVNQSKLMDELGKLLITVELGTPALYATTLKLISGENPTLQGGVFLGLTFFLWLIALFLSLFAIFPKKYKINSSRLDQIENFYHESAAMKAKILLVSLIIFFIGIGCSIFTII